LSSKKGQVFSSDLVTATVLFTVALGVLSASWHVAMLRVEEARWMLELERKAYLLSDFLAKTPGTPADWESNPGGNVTGVGLAYFDREIDPGKLSSLTGVGEERLRRLFRLGGDRYQIILRRVDGVVEARLGEPPRGEYAVKYVRTISYRGRPAFLEVTVWGERTYGGVLL